jgi:hypothetical protein
VLDVVFAASEPSKVPWFIAGGVLAVYAVILATIGIKRPNFPYSKLGERAVITLTVALVAIAIAMAIVTA